ncbi:MAG: hypothetical protein AAF135_12410 [Bacteroidota bacterium]
MKLPLLFFIFFLSFLHPQIVQSMYGQYSIDLSLQQVDAIPPQTEALVDLVFTGTSESQFDDLVITFRKAGKSPYQLSRSEMAMESHAGLQVGRLLITPTSNPITRVSSWTPPYQVEIKYKDLTKVVEVGSNGTNGTALTPPDEDNTAPTPSFAPGFDCESLLQSRSLVQHSLRFAEAVDAGDKDPIICLLNFYGRKGQNEVRDYAELKELFKQNPFFTSILEDLGPGTDFNWDSAPIDSTVILIKRNGSIAQNLAGDPPAEAQSLVLDGLNTLFPPSEVLPALAEFTANRFKEEINIAFLNRLRDRLSKSTELQSIFPNSYRLLAYADMFSYNVFVGDLKQAFDDDLQDLDRNIATYLRVNRDSLYLKGKAEEFATAIDFTLLAYDSWKAEEAGLHPAEIVRLWGNYDFSPKVPQNISGAIQTMALISKNLEISKYQDNKLTFGWASQDELLQMSRDKMSIRAFLGFIYEADESTMRDINFRIKTEDGAATKVVNLWTLFQDNDERANNLIEFVFDMLHQIQELQTVAKNVQTIARENKALKLEGKFTEIDKSYYRRAYAQYADALSDLLAPFLKKGNNFWEPTEEQRAIAEKIGIFLAFNRELNSLVLAARNREFEEALLKAVSILDNIYDYAEATTYEPVVREFVQIGTFMTTVAQADSSEEILAIIEEAALPVGSYSIKRSNRLTVSINSFVGAAGGYEMYQKSAVTDNPADSTNVSQGFFAFTAPIGVAISLGPSRDKLNYKESLGKNILAGSSHTLFFSLIDIGALTAVSLNNDTLLSTLPALSWQNVFAPGVHYYWGIPTTPLALGVGTQFGPALRGVQGNDTDIRTSSFRVQLGLTVDIPFYHVGINPGRNLDRSKREKRWTNREKKKAAKAAAK